MNHILPASQNTTKTKNIIKPADNKKARREYIPWRLL
jgi:hypothetical protein